MKKREAKKILKAVYSSGKMLNWGKHLINKMEQYRFQEGIVKVGDFYEGCDFRPRKCIEVDLDPHDPRFFTPDDGNIFGMSLLGDQEEVRGCGIYGCGVIRLTQKMVDERIEAYKRGGLDEMIDTVCNKNNRYGIGTAEEYKNGYKKEDQT